MRRRLTILASALALALIGACTSPAPPPAPEPEPFDGTNDIVPTFTEWSRTATDSGATLALDGVEIVVPPGAVPAGEEISVRAGKPIGMQDGPFITERIGAPVEVVHESDLLAPLTITWDVSDVPAEDLAVIMLARWNDDAAAWELQPTEATYDGEQITAEIQDFSFWTWISTKAAEVSQISGQVFGGRAGAPSCSGGLPDWVDGTVRPDEVMSGAPLRVCFEDQGGDVLAKIVNNRPYIQIVTFDADVEIADFLPTSAAALAPLALNGFLPDNQVAIPPTSEAKVVISRPSAVGSVVITGRSKVNGLTIAADLLGMTLAEVPLGGFDSPAVNIAVQLIFQCGGSQIADVALAGGVDESIVAKVVDVIASCSAELVRPDSDLSRAYKRSLTTAAKKGGMSASEALQDYRSAGLLASRAAALQFLKATQYVAELFAESTLDPSILSVRGRGAAAALGAWTPVCTDPRADSDLLYRNLALQDEFADTSLELWQFPGWQAAAAKAVAPLAACTPEQRAALAELLPGDWGDPTAARMVADAVRALDGLKPTTANYGIGMAALPDGATWLFDVPSQSGESSGGAAMVQLLRIAEPLTFPSSTGQWVGCQGQTAETIYNLDGAYSTFSVAFGLRNHTPADLTANLTITGDDGGVLLSESVTVGTALERREIDVTGLNSLTVRARTDDECTVSSDAYAAFLDSWVR